MRGTSGTRNEEVVLATTAHDLRNVSHVVSSHYTGVAGSLLMRWLIAVLAGALVVVSAVIAQDSAQPEAERQVIHRVAPSYPDLARRVGITGVVKLVAVVSPEGSVKSAEAVGGNPVLITAAKDAVKGWKFSPATHETRQLIELRFSSH